MTSSSADRLRKKISTLRALTDELREVSIAAASPWANRPTTAREEAERRIADMEARQGMFNYRGGLTEEREAATRTIKEQKRALIEDGSSQETDRALKESLFGPSQEEEERPQPPYGENDWVLA